MIFSLDVRPARKGDCLLLHCGTEDNPGLILIDGGPSRVYQPHLRPRLLEIKQARGLEDDEPLPLDVLMVSHVDDDHIKGILDLTRELLDAQKPLIRVGGLWHNSFDEILNRTPKELTASVEAQFGAASLEGELPDEATVEGSEEDEEVVRATLKVLAGIAQGHRLRLDAKKLKWELNLEFDGKLILADKNEVSVLDGLSIIVAGPMQPELVQLQKKHDAWVKSLVDAGKKPSEALAAYVDKSVHNLSSLVLLVSSGGKQMLLTGDARGDKILEGLEAVGVLDPGGKMHVDLLKVPHHGSANNLDTDFFERITADHYVFCGNGEHGNPERESLEMLFDARGEAPFTVHLTYPIETIDVAREEDWNKEQAKEKKRKAAGSKKPVRPDWSPEEHSLTAFFAGLELTGRQELLIVGDDAPHIINLLDPVGF
jgi:beta-lactamase superfamily II metal-dependent hydrolase